jgi:2-desacetyl-2-hydroxyethyl bacteriochlorophyllide A dehydrogenase
MPTVGANQLLIRTRLSLISPGTERAFFLGLPNTSQSYPQSAGYSNIGQVIEVGSQVKGWNVGDRVANTANHVLFAAMDADRCVPAPPDLADEEAVFFNLAAIALQGIRKARLELGESVVVIGAGLIGLLAMQLARLNGGLPVAVIDLDERRLEFARQVGADMTIRADEGLSTAVAILFGEEGVSVVVEATGHPQAILTAFALAKQHGRVILLGSTRGETEQVNFYRDVHKKGLTVIGAHNMTRPQHDSAPGWWTMKADQRVALRLLAARRLTVQPLITHRFSWRKATHAYDLLKQWDLNALGMVLDWREG